MKKNVNKGWEDVDSKDVTSWLEKTIKIIGDLMKKDENKK